MSFNALKIAKKYIIITAVLPQHVSPFPRNYRDLRPHPRGVTVRYVPITAEYPRLPRYYRDPHPRAALYYQHAPRDHVPASCDIYRWYAAEFVDGGLDL